MENLIFQVPACVTNITTRSDKTLKLTIDTQELSPEENAILFKLHQKTGWMMFKSNTFQASDIPKDNAKITSKELKTPSQRLRAVLFIQWKQHKLGGSFEHYYENWINERIEEIKRNLS